MIHRIHGKPPVPESKFSKAQREARVTQPTTDPPRVVLANDLPYTDGEEDPREALRSTLAFAVDDWGESRAMSWVYGIVLGWDGDDGPSTDPDDDAMAEQAARHGWDASAVARLRRLHAAFEARADRPPEPPTLDAAWKEALAAFPQGWGSVNIWPPFPGDPWMVQVTKQVRFGRGGASRYNRFRGEGDDLAAALRSLADALREAPR